MSSKTKAATKAPRKVDGVMNARTAGAKHPGGMGEKIALARTAGAKHSGGSALPPPLGTTNFYKIIPKSILDVNPKITYANQSKINIHLPSGFNVCASSGAGKTNWVLNFISLVDSFDRVTIYAKKLDESLYIYLIHCLEKAGIQHEEFDHLDSVIPAKEYDSTKNNLVIIDDWMNAPKKALEPIIDLFTLGRKNGLSPVWLSQSYFQGCPQTIRLNVNYLVIIKLKSKKDIARIMSDASVDVEPEELIRLLTHVQSLGQGNFMLIDKVTNDPALKIRVNFGI